MVSQLRGSRAHGKGRAVYGALPRNHALRKPKLSGDHHDSAPALRFKHRTKANPFCPERERLIVQFLPLVRRIAFQMHEHLPAHVEVDDLIGAGVIGLIEAVRKFDTGKHVKLESYARHRIRGAILDGLRGLDTASRDMRKKVKKAERIHRELEFRFGRPVGNDEIAAGLGMSLKRWYRTVRELQPAGVEWLRPMEAIEFKPPDEEALPAAGSESAWDRCYRSEQIAVLNRALSCLSERDRRLMSLYYEHDLTMKDVGERLGIDESRVSQIHSALLLRLKTRAKALLRPTQLSAPPAYMVAEIAKQSAQQEVASRAYE